MTLGTLYGIGIGPGDPELITLRGSRLLSGCPHVLVPKARDSADSLALNIIGAFVNPKARIHEVVFPMTSNREELGRKWLDAALYAAEILKGGEDLCYPTLGDAYFYSTYIYLVRTLRDVLPGVRIITVPGVTAFSAVAALTGFPVGEGKGSVTVVPAADDLTDLELALERRGTVIIMKIGSRLEAILDLLEKHNAMDGGVFVSHAGMADEKIETDLHSLRGSDATAGYLSIIMIHSNGKEGS